MSGKPSPCRIDALIHDPEVGGDLLALGAAMVVLLDHGYRKEHRRLTGRKVNVGDVARMVFPGAHDPAFRLQRVLADDARRYEPPRGRHGDPCEAPMIRRDGPCGKTDRTNAVQVFDWETGEQHPLTACYRHKEWQRVTHRRNHNERPENVPTPPANAGGKMREHFPELDWPVLWRWATHNRWVEPPEREPVRKPTLQVIVGDAEDVTGDRAMLTALPGGTWSAVGVET